MKKVLDVLHVELFVVGVSSLNTKKHSVWAELYSLVLVVML